MKRFSLFLLCSMSLSSIAFAGWANQRGYDTSGSTEYNYDPGIFDYGMTGTFLGYSFTVTSRTTASYSEDICNFPSAWSYAKTEYAIHSDANSYNGDRSVSSTSSASTGFKIVDSQGMPATTIPFGAKYIVDYDCKGSSVFSVSDPNHNIYVAGGGVASINSFQACFAAPGDSSDTKLGFEEEFDLSATNNISLYGSSWAGLSVNGNVETHGGVTINSIRLSGIDLQAEGLTVVDLADNPITCIEDSFVGKK